MTLSMVMLSEQPTGGVRQHAKENGHITPLNRRPGARNGARGRHRAPLLRKSRKSANIQNTSGFIWGIPAYGGIMEGFYKGLYSDA
jgi:hypothetical protein